MNSKPKGDWPYYIGSLVLGTSLGFGVDRCWPDLVREHGNVVGNAYIVTSLAMAGIALVWLGLIWLRR